MRRREQRTTAREFCRRLRPDGPADQFWNHLRRGLVKGSWIVNGGLTLPLNLNPRANGIFQTCSYDLPRDVSGARLKAAPALPNGETGTWSILRIQR
jgi:hypothetical protein